MTWLAVSGRPCEAVADRKKLLVRNFELRSSCQWVFTQWYIFDKVGRCRFRVQGLA
jgi:hypothetical protein